MSFQNRNSKRNSSKRKRTSAQAGNSYEQLESRQMLTVDLGLNFVSGEFDDPAPFTTPDVSGAVGPNHIVELVNGGYSIRDRAGNLLQATTAQEFFQDIAEADISAGIDVFGEAIEGELQDARIVYDESSGRFFASAVVSAGNGADLPGNDILLAISRTDNPIDGFRSVQFTGDLSGNLFNGFATLAVTATSVTISTNNTGGGNETTSIFSIPKDDLLSETPTLDNFTRFDDLDSTVFGSTIQFASDTDGSSAFQEVSSGISTFASGNTISLTRVIGTSDGTDAVLQRVDVLVPEYTAAPDGRQPNAVDNLNNISPTITGSAIEEGGFIWVVHTVEGTNGNSAIRWYQIDNTSLSLVNTDLIEDPQADYLNPSIAVNDFGGIAIGFTGTGPLLPPSGFIHLGFSAMGLQDAPTVTFPQAPVMFQQGLSNLVNVQADGTNPFGEFSSTTFDPDNPFSFLSFQQFVPANNVFGTAVVEASINDISPVINANDLDNTVVLRRSEINNGWLEIVIDGNVTDTYVIDTLDRLTINLGDGNDVVEIDYLLGDIATDLGFEINAGGGIDEIDLIDVSGHAFAITGDGAGTLDGINDFTGIEILSGSSAADSFTSFNAATDFEINGEGGNDTIFIDNTSTGNYILRGSVGDDTYTVPITNFPQITVIDSVGFENDTLIGLGTIQDDVILINNDQIVLNGTDVSFFGFDGIENQSFDGAEGDDLLIIRGIQGTTTVAGDVGNDTFDIASNPPATTGLDGIAGELTIDGGAGTNRLIISNTDGIPTNAIIDASQISGLTDSPITYVGNFGTSDGLQGIIVNGSDLGADQFDIRNILENNSVLVRGGAGADVFNVRSSTVGDVVLDGEEGSDTFRTTFGSVNRFVQVVDTGGNGLDRFSVRTTDNAEEFTINNNSFGFFGEQFAWSGVENLVVDTLDGADAITVNDNQTPFIRVSLGEGDDSGAVIGSSGLQGVRFDGLGGNDDFQLTGSVAATFINANGGEGADTFNVTVDSFGRGRVDGGNGDDIVTIAFASRDSRRINARDTGDGNDTLNVLGTPTADRVEVRPRVLNREGEIITYDEGTETIDFDTFGSNDIIDVFGTSAAEFIANLGVGNDTVNVNSTSTTRDEILFQFSLAAGIDTANVFRTSEVATVQIFGQEGPDNFNVGSTLLTDDGNLNLIRGNLFIGGGTQGELGQDFLQVNDRGNTDVPYGFNITDSSFSNAPGPFDLQRPFSSFGFSGIEFVLASGTDANNTFNVTASPSTVIRVDGNSNGINGDSLNVFVGANVTSQLFGDSQTGFLDFNSGLQNVSFTEIEDVDIVNFGATSLALDSKDARDSFFGSDDDDEDDGELDDLLGDLGLDI